MGFAGLAVDVRDAVKDREPCAAGGGAVGFSFLPVIRALNAASSFGCTSVRRLSPSSSGKRRSVRAHLTQVANSFGEVFELPAK